MYVCRWLECMKVCFLQLTASRLLSSDATFYISVQAGIWPQASQSFGARCKDACLAGDQPMPKGVRVHLVSCLHSF
jgi:hypothetical protein